ncbi:MAG: 8-oxoguanine deaminase [Pseudomonadota bacterium]
MEKVDILIKNSLLLATMDDDREIVNGQLAIKDNKIIAIGTGLDLEFEAARVIDATGCLVLPGLINTHHHLYQTLTRAIPLVQDAKLFDWLTNLYELWREIDEEGFYISAKAGIAELLLTGCTTTSDHLYLFPKGAKNLIDVEIKAAQEMGIRFNATRGSMSRGKSQGGLPPDDVIQTEDEILTDSERLINQYHDSSDFSMCRVSLAPCSPFSVTPELMKQTAELARKKNVLLHTHLCETMDEEDYCISNLGMRPLKYMESVDWLGNDVWYAHGIHFNEDELKVLAEAGTGIAHCPVSNLRLGSGIAKIPQFLEMGGKVGIAVDGSASNDSSSLLAEVKMSMLVHRIGTSVESMPARKALQIATTGGASIFNRKDIGQLKKGMAADIAIFKLDDLAYAGSLSDPLAALLFCGHDTRAEYVIVNGKLLVENKKIINFDTLELTEMMNKKAKEMLDRAEKNSGINFLKRK